MTVDIIIPTYNPDETLCLLLHKLQGQTFVVHRVIILNTEEAFWKQAVAAYPIEQVLQELPCEYEVIHIAKKDFDHGGTRQFGAEHSDADVMIFMTQDAVPADEFLVENLVEALGTGGESESKQKLHAEVSALEQQNMVETEDTAVMEKDITVKEYEKGGDTLTSVAVAYARQLPKHDCHIVEQYTRQFNYPEQSRIKTKADIPVLGIKTFFCSDVCAAYRKDLFEELGGFESPVIFNEDMFFAANAISHGYGVAYAAEAKVVHSHNYTMRQQFHRNFDLAVSQKQHPEIFEQVSSEAEGMKLVKSTVAYLFKIRKPWLIFHFGMQCVGKYAGFWLGKHYEKLSRKQILKYTMSPGYWELVDRNNE